MTRIDAPLRAPSPPQLPRRPEQRRAVLPASPTASGLARWFRRREPTTYHRCLAVHIHFAAPRSALS